jgi:hypothetical protein
LSRQVAFSGEPYRSGRGQAVRMFSQPMPEMRFLRRVVNSTSFAGNVHVSVCHAMFQRDV